MKNLWSKLTVLILLALPWPVFSQDDLLKEIRLYVGQVQIIAVNNPSRIVIGNPAIADVTDVTKTEMTVSPKKQGSTSLIFWDKAGEQSYKLIVMKEDMTDIKRRVDSLIGTLNLPFVFTQIAAEESKVLLLGYVKSAAERERINTALGDLKEKTTDLIEVKEEESIIEIDVNVVELNKDSTKTLGFSWPGAITLTDVSGVVTNAVTGLNNVFRVSDFTRTAFNVTLDALVEEGKAKILSRPRLACQSGKEAELVVGGEKPIFTTNVISGGGEGTEVEYKEFGIKLKIKPTVMEGDKIKLGLNVEVSEVGTAEFIGLSSNRTAQAYPLTKRMASTELILSDGQTMAIGGLIKQKSEEDVRKTAFLGDMPILGFLFRKTTSKTGGGKGERGDTELFITLTPTLVDKKSRDIKETAEEPQEIKETAVIPLAEEAPAAEEVKERPVSAAKIPDTMSTYVWTVQNKINRAITYPRQALDAGWEGQVKLTLNIASNGQLKDIKIKDSSGYRILDDAALDVARSQAPYPPFSPQIDSQEIWVDVPIAYEKN
jgi:pilus assembly protein CpaC